MKTNHFTSCSAPVCAEMNENPADIVELDGEIKCVLLVRAKKLKSKTDLAELKRQNRQ